MQVNIILAAQDEAALYFAHNGVRSGMYYHDGLDTTAASATVYHMIHALNSTSSAADPYPIDPFPRPFWYMFFLVSPSAALVWYRAVDLTLEGMAVCVARLKMFLASCLCC